MPIAPQTSAKYELVSPSGYRAVWNDRADPDFVGDVTEISGFDGAMVREDGEDRPQTDGRVSGPTLFGSRPLTLTGKVMHATTAYERDTRIEKMEATVQDCARTPGILTWTLLTGEMLTTSVKIQQPPRISGAWVKEFQVGMVADDPLIYSYAESLVSSVYRGTGVTSTSDSLLYSTAPMGQPVTMRFPAPFPLSWTENPDPGVEALAYGAVQLVTKGSAPTPPRIELQGFFNEWNGAPEPNLVTTIPLHILNATTNERLILSVQMFAGDRLTLDFRTKRVLKNGVSVYNTIDVPNSTWWNLVPGANEVLIIGADKNTLAGTGSITEVAWRDAWR